MRNLVAGLVAAVQGDGKLASEVARSQTSAYRLVPTWPALLPAAFLGQQPHIS